MITHEPASTPHIGKHASRLIDTRRGLYLILRLAGFLSTNLLVTWGLFVLFFLMLGGLTFDGLVRQLNNLTSRFVAADTDRGGAFKVVILAANILLFAGVAVLRRHSLLPLQMARWSRQHG